MPVPFLKEFVELGRIIIIYTGKLYFIEKIS